ncbi:hypothetical protein Y032_0091g2422 [Ancylostoma ceylanicum]|uniref:Uncharacterized protein n=1 Tax=Ancylostoma ceylanicum TaxID=53326 RepID=A0A016TM90_9BILA|nr:hypothetical protein Y032_0091g2422 [Ancylostoma ceylanicum]
MAFAGLQRPCFQRTLYGAPTCCLLWRRRKKFIFEGLYDPFDENGLRKSSLSVYIHALHLSLSIVYASTLCELEHVFLRLP